MENRIGEARREYAEAVGRFTQEDAARYFGVSLSTYQKWEQGKGLLNGSQLRDIAKKYGKSVDYILMVSQLTDSKAESQYELSPDEKKLIDGFRKMTEEGKSIVLALVDYRGEVK